MYFLASVQERSQWQEPSCILIQNYSLGPTEDSGGALQVMGTCCCEQATLAGSSSPQGVQCPFLANPESL